MRDIQSTAFSETLEKRIQDTERAAQEIHAGNMLFLAPCHIKKNDNLGDENIQWDDNANVNGFDIQKISAMIRFLKASKVKLVGTYGTVDIDRVNWQHKVPVPSGYSGRNAFVSFYLATQGKPTVDMTTRSKAWCTQNEHTILFETKNIQMDTTPTGGSASLVYVIIFSRLA